MGLFYSSSESILVSDMAQLVDYEDEIRKLRLVSRHVIICQVLGLLASYRNNNAIQGSMSSSFATESGLLKGFSLNRTWSPSVMPRSLPAAVIDV